MADDRRQFSPSASRNKQFTLEVLQRVLPPHGHALEIASGTGEHAAHFAAALPGWTWQPTEVDRAAFTSIDAWRAVAGAPNMLVPQQLDVSAPDWHGVEWVDAIFCANMIHIAPWTACQGLMRGAGRHLVPQGFLITYGPYLIDDGPNAPSNLAFDADLRCRDPAWGVRRLADVLDEASRAALSLRERVSMPANNLMLIFQRDGLRQA
jgi:hypothetical protein